MPKSVLSRHFLVLSAIALIGQSSLGQEDEVAPIVSPKPAETAATAATPSAAPTVAAASPTAAATPGPVDGCFVQRTQGAFDRPGSDGRARLRHRARPAQSRRLLRRARHGRPFQDRTTTASVSIRFSISNQLLSIGAVAVAPSDSDVVWVGNWRRKRSEFIGMGRWSLSFDRWWRDMDECRPEGKPCDPAPGRPSDETGNRLRRRARQPLEGWRRSRVVQDDRRRQDLETRFARAFA